MGLFAKLRRLANVAPILIVGLKRVVLEELYFISLEFTFRLMVHMFIDSFHIVQFIRSKTDPVRRTNI
jgi:hypothetical protein